MPKKTFYNLEDTKRKLITNAFLNEFARKPYDDASISEVVKSLGISKGSIYQYFENKLDLFIYLIGTCTEIKRKYVESKSRSEYEDFWSYFKDLYEFGYQFDDENPFQSQFLHNLIENINSPSVKSLFSEMQLQTVSVFEDFVRHEVELGLFREDIPVKTMGFMLYKIGIIIQEDLMYSGKINPQESIRNNTPIYKGKRKELINTVENYIRLFKPAFNKK